MTGETGRAGSEEPESPGFCSGTDGGESMKGLEVSGNVGNAEGEEKRREEMQMKRRKNAMFELSFGWDFWMDSSWERVWGFKGEV